MIGTIIVVATISIMLFILIYVYFKCKRGYSSDNSLSKSIELLTIIASLATIIALFVAISTYNQGIKIQNENDKFILENLITEIEGNLLSIEYFETNIEGYKEKPHIVISYLKYNYMERAVNFIKDNTLRRKMIIAIDDMQQSNYLKDNIRNLPAPSEARSTDIDTLNRTNVRITPKLVFINQTVAKILQKEYKKV